MSPTLHFIYCFTGFIGIMEGLFYMYVSIYVFQKHVKSRKIYMYVDYTHDQLNTTHFIIVFRIFFEGGRKI